MNSRAKTIVVMILIGGAVLTAPESGFAQFGLAPGMKAYFDSGAKTQFRFELQYDLAVHDYFRFHLAWPIEVGGEFVLGGLAAGPKITIPVHKYVTPYILLCFNFHGGFVYEGWTDSYNELGFYGFGGYFGPGVMFNLKPVELFLEITFDIGKWVWVEEKLDSSTYKGLNLVVGVMFP